MRIVPPVLDSPVPLANQQLRIQRYNASDGFDYLAGFRSYGFVLAQPEMER
jgi:hypothetical protein